MWLKTIIYVLCLVFIAVMPALATSSNRGANAGTAVGNTAARPSIANKTPDQTPGGTTPNALSSGTTATGMGTSVPAGTSTGNVAAPRSQRMNDTMGEADRNTASPSSLTTQELAERKLQREQEAAARKTELERLQSEIKNAETEEQRREAAEAYRIKLREDKLEWRQDRVEAQQDERADRRKFDRND